MNNFGLNNNKAIIQELIDSEILKVQSETAVLRESNILMRKECVSLRRYIQKIKLFNKNIARRIIIKKSKMYLLSKNANAHLK